MSPPFVMAIEMAIRIVVPVPRAIPPIVASRQTAGVQLERVWIIRAGEIKALGSRSTWVKLYAAFRLVSNPSLYKCPAIF